MPPADPQQYITMSGQLPFLETSAKQGALQVETISVDSGTIQSIVIRQIATPEDAAGKKRFDVYVTCRNDGEGNFLGHFTIITSPCLSANLGNINDSLINDTVPLCCYLRDKVGLNESPWCREFGVLKANDPQREIQSVAQVRKEITVLANLKHGGEVVIAYSGHGSSSGNWVIQSDERLDIQEFTFKEFKQIWIGSQVSRGLKLTLILDCCFAGEWANRLKDDEELAAYPVAILCASSVIHRCCLFCLTGCCDGRARQFASVDGAFVNAICESDGGRELPKRFVFYKTERYNSLLFSSLMARMQELR